MLPAVCIRLSVLFITALSQGIVLAYRRHTSSFYNPAVEYGPCPPGYAYQYFTNSCAWVGPLPVWQPETMDGDNYVYSNQASKPGGDNKCPDGYKFSKVLRLCLLPNLCSFCKRSSYERMKKQGDQEGSGTTEKPYKNTANQSPYAIPKECLCEI